MASAAPLCVLTICWPGLETESSEAHVRPHCVCVYCALYTLYRWSPLATHLSLGDRGHRGESASVTQKGLGWQLPVIVGIHKQI